MSQRHKEWARQARERLLARLGKHCKWCFTTKNLSFDCIIPQGDAHHRKDTSARMCFYHAQHREGNLQVLCERCNALKGDADTSAPPEFLFAHHFHTSASCPF